MKHIPLYKSVLISEKKLTVNTISSLKRNDYIFLSLHYKEEWSKSFIKDSKEICNLASKKGLRIIADVSKRTCELFKCKDIASLAKKLHINTLRIDYGFTSEEIAKIASKINVAINASTITEEELKPLLKHKEHIIAIHNFYPREETGLDVEQFIRKTYVLKQLGIKTYAYIASDKNKRGPMFDGLPTLEHQRYYPPHVSFIELDKSGIVDGVFLGDLSISDKEEKLIKDYQKDDIVPLFIDKKSEVKLLNKPLTSRIDSPLYLIRIKESREYATKGASIKPKNNIKRKCGSITIDNVNYKRYSGEMMITRADFPADKRVNVIGTISDDSMPLLKYIRNGDKFKFIK